MYIIFYQLSNINILDIVAEVGNRILLCLFIKEGKKLNERNLTWLENNCNILRTHTKGVICRNLMFIHHFRHRQIINSWKILRIKTKTIFTNKTNILNKHYL